VETQTIVICPAARAEKYIVRNLLELCRYDYSEFNGDDLDDSGFFGYTYLDHYWTEPGRYPFLLRVEGKLAGFVLVRQLDDMDALTYEMAEFFIVRKYRRQGLATLAALAIFARFPAVWRLHQEAGNLPAQMFWHKVLARSPYHAYREWQLDDGAGIAQEFIVS